MDPHSLILGTWKIDSIGLYFVLVILLDLCVRGFTKFLGVIDRERPFRKFFKTFCEYYLAKGKETDHWLTFILGLFEISIYPILIATNNWSFIGAWLAFKTVSQWKRWDTDRNSFIRFLIGNILVLLAAYFFLSGYVITK